LALTADPALSSSLESCPQNHEFFFISDKYTLWLNYFLIVIFAPFPVLGNFSTIFVGDNFSHSSYLIEFSGKSSYLTKNKVWITGRRWKKSRIGKRWRNLQKFKP